ncbi:MAG: HAD-IIIC family phosphatase [Candidatus Omnitrophota bacterium]
MNPTVRGLILSDFTVDTLKAFLVNDPQAPAWNIDIAPYGQVLPILNNPGDPLWAAHPDVTIIWTQITHAIPSFRKLLSFEAVDPAQLLKECDTFIDAIINASTHSRFVLLASWTLPPYLRGYGPGDLKNPQGWQRALLTLNNHLAGRLSENPNIFILNTATWTQSIGANAFNPKLWYLSKTPFDPGVFKLAAQDIKATMLACWGTSRKLLIVDLDDTLWGGTVGENGWQDLKIGGHDAIGEAYSDFQQGLKGLKNRGIILGIVSKNESATALEAINKHPEMILKRTDFAGWRINWDDKAANITALLSELNLGADAAVFIDNDPAERDRVRRALPEILVPDWPDHCLLFPKALSSLSCFDTVRISAEDRARTGMYAAEQQRREGRAQAQDIGQWLRSLDINVTAELLNAANLPRAAQLLNKTNQMNLSTRRLSEQELLAWTETPGRRLWTFRVKDNLGDSGLAGIISLEVDGKTARIIDLVLSCRVFGRLLENAMMAVLIEQAVKQGAATVKAHYIPTEKNKPCLDFLRERSGFQAAAGHIFTWDTAKAYPRPDMIKVAYEG